MRVSLLQFAAATDVAANVATIGGLMAKAASEAHPSGDEPHVVVLPEAAMRDLGGADAPLGPDAQDLDGPFVAELARLATRHRVTVVAGMFERSPDSDRPYNTLVAVGPGGGLVAAYRKIHLYDSFGYRESDRLTAGDGTLAVLPMDDFALGLMTCYDVRFPELGRALVDGGADVFVVPAAWVRGPLKEDHWVTLVRARAIENTVYVVAAGQCGRAYVGRSMVVDPLGVVRAGMGTEEGVLHAGLDPSVLEDARRLNPSLRNRRPLLWQGFRAEPGTGDDPSDTA